MDDPIPIFSEDQKTRSLQLDEKEIKVLLLVNNCFAHGKELIATNLHNVHVKVLPTKITRKVQLLDAGIIAWVKGQYRRRSLLCVFENLEANSEMLYIVDVLIAIRWTECEWNRCSVDVIKHCFTH